MKILSMALLFATVALGVLDGWALMAFLA